jgi:hypothetical protein
MGSTGRFVLEPFVHTRAQPARVETHAAGRLSVELVDQMVADYRRMARTQGAPWLLRAEGATSIAPEAVSRAVLGLTELGRDRALRRVVAVITVASVKMSASVLAMSLRAAGCPVEVVVVDTLDAAEAQLRA